MKLPLLAMKKWLVTIVLVTTVTGAKLWMPRPPLRFLNLF